MGMTWATFFPHRAKNVPSNATVIGAPSWSRYFMTRRATARPREQVTVLH
jgi:hypothetical protein